MGLFDKMLSSTTLYGPNRQPTVKIIKVREHGRQIKRFEYAIKHPEDSDRTLLVYGEIDGNEPLIHGASDENNMALTREEFERLENRIYDAVLEEWIDEYSSYLDLEYEAMKDRYYGI